MGCKDARCVICGRILAGPAAEVFTALLLKVAMRFESLLRLRGHVTESDRAPDSIDYDLETDRLVLRYGEREYVVTARELFEARESSDRFAAASGLFRRRINAN